MIIGLFLIVVIIGLSLYTLYLNWRVRNVLKGGK